VRNNHLDRDQLHDDDDGGPERLAEANDAGVGNEDVADADMRDDAPVMEIGILKSLQLLVVRIKLIKLN